MTYLKLQMMLILKT